MAENGHVPMVSSAGCVSLHFRISFWSRVFCSDPVKLSPGCSHEAVDMFTEAYKLDEGVANACKAVSGKPVCSWHQNDDNTYDHLFVAAHYIQKDEVKGETEGEVAPEDAEPAGGCCTGEKEVLPGPDGISGFVYQQVFMIFYPNLNTIISIDANGEKMWDGVTDLLQNECGFVRVNEDCSVLIYKLLDSMIDEVYPLLDLYGDLLENLEFETMAADEPTDNHVTTQTIRQLLVRSGSIHSDR